MNTCGECRFRGDELESYDSKLGRDAKNGSFLCGKIEHDNDPEFRKSSDKATVIDGSGYYAALCVAEDFGCVLWEPRDGA